MEIGDILICHWGQDLIGIDYYQVVKRTFSCVGVQQIFAAESGLEILPVRNRFLSRCRTYRVKYDKKTNCNFIEIARNERARLYEGTVL